MKYIETIPICANALFIYKLDIKNDWTLKFKKEKFKPAKITNSETDKFMCLVGEDFNALNKYKELNKEIKKAVDQTLKKKLMLENIDYRIFSSWITKTPPQSFSDPHNHCNSWLSGVYYPKGNPGFGIKFYHDGISQFFTPPKKYNTYNSREWVVIPKDNYLVLFFSQLRHQIMPNLSSEDRYSLAFNIIPTGNFGTGDSNIKF
jgi:uncharacterized protein (TIGR02466 family)|tara:strand:+ start:70 stop:681 length:612 start_codon:yes stop_codon:yes gene_type:complete